MKFKVPLFNHPHLDLPCVPSLLRRGRGGRGIKGVVIGTVPVFVLAFLLFASYSYALIDLSIFGPKRYDRLKGAPTVYTDTFERCNPAQYAVLKIQNGGSKETRIKAGSVYVNGVEVVTENEFKEFVPYIEKTVPVKDVNELKVVLKSGMQDDPNNKLLKDQSFLIIEVVGKGCDDTPPTISNPQPADGSLLNNGSPVISASYADNAGGTGIDAAIASIKVDGSDVTSSSSVTASGISYTPSSKLPEGEHTVAVSVSDKAHNASTLTWRFATDTVAPSVKIASHINNQYLNTPTIALSGTVGDDTLGNPLFAKEGAGGVVVTVNGVPAQVSGNTFVVSNLSLSEGSNTITVTATDRAGNIGTASININLDTIPPVVGISYPHQGDYLNTPNISVTGSINEPVTSVKVNGVNVGAIQQGVGGQGPGVSFNLEKLNLIEGSNTINIEVVDRAGNVGSGQIGIALDTIPPVINITAPIRDSFVNTQQIAVAGNISELHPNGLWVNDNPVDATGQSPLQFNTSISFNEGQNIIRLKAMDMAGNISEVSVSLTLDTVLPVVAIVSPAEGFLTNNPQVDVSGKINEPVTSLAVNNMNVGAIGQSPYEFIKDMTLSEGLNTITIQAVDRAGNIGSATVNGTLDTIAPAPPVLDALNTPTNISVATITGKAEPGSTVKVFTSGSATQTIGTANADSTGVFSITNVAMAEGINTFSATATDTVGNTSGISQPVSATLDTKAPAVKIASHVNNQYLNTPTITLTGTLSDDITGNPGGIVNVDVNGHSATVTGNAFALSNLSLSEGVNTITVEARDPAGNISTDSIVINLDTVPPTVSISSPSANAYLNTSQINVTGTVNEPVTSVTLNGQTVAADPSNMTPNFVSDLTLTEGSNTIIVTAKDRAGNTGAGSITITLDTAAPTIQVSSPVHNTYVNTPNITVSGTISEPVTSLTVNGTQVGAINEMLQFSQGITLAEGENTITISATDPAGNTVTKTLTVTLDTVAPAISVTSPSQNAYADLPNISVSGTVTDASINPLFGKEHPSGYKGAGGVTLTINDVPIELTGQSPLQFNTGLTLVPGLNTINLKATDLAGNVSTASVTVTLDSTPPVVTITEPATGSLFNKSGVKVTGTVNEAVTSLTINGTLVVASGQGSGVSFNLENLTLLEGLNNIVVQAIDRAGNSGTASVSVTVDSTAPDAPVLDSLSTPTKVSPVTIAGSSEAGATVKVIRSASGAQEQIGTATADSQGRFSIQNVILKEGANTFTATATDAAGNASSASLPVSAVLDSMPPVITVTAPANNSYTNVAIVKVTGSLNEDASLTINGTETRAIGQSPLQFEKDITLTSGINSIQLTAKDAAGNQTTSTVLVTLDQTAPVVTITSPVSGAVVGSSTVTVTGTVNEPVTNLAINGASVGATAVVSGQGPGVSFNLASLNLSDGTNTITVEATDKAGNTGTATMQVSVDSMPPVVTLNAPSEAAAGATISISAGAEDPSGVSLVELSANGVTIWSENQWSGAGGQWSVVYTLSPDFTTGTIINITAKATDATGLTGTATATINVSQGPTGPGYIQGEVYEDIRGLRLEGAKAEITAVVSGNAPIQITTGADGGYFTEAPAGDYLITISKPGYTTVERKITVKPEKNIAPLDARLTPISSVQNLIDANGGKISTTPTPPYQGGEQGEVRLDLAIPPNALTEQADIRLTPLSNQGLIGLMPKGWSPIAGINIENAVVGGQGSGASVTFAEAASLRVPVAPGITLEPSSQVILAHYVGAGLAPAHDWLVSSFGTVSSDGKFITASVPSTGQYAFIIPDQTLTSAPSASSAVKDILAVSAPSVSSEQLTAVGKVKPAAAPPSVGLKAVGEVVLTSNVSPLTSDGSLVSGLVVNAKVTERFDLLSGEVETPSEYIQDLVLYRYPCITNNAPSLPLFSKEGDGGSLELSPAQVRTTFPISPSRDYSIIELMMGKVGIDITLPAPDASGTVVGPEGARLVDADGNVLNIPQGALTSSTPVETKTVAASMVSGIVGPDFTLLRAINVNIGRDLVGQASCLSRAGSLCPPTIELSIPAPQGINLNLPIVIARAIEVKGATKLKLVAVGKLSGSLISSSAFSASSAVKGLNVSGTYYFLQAKTALGFVTGKVTDASNNPYPSALVTSNTCSLADLTGPDGNYLIASKVSTFIATATDIYRNDKGIASGTIASANQVQTVNLTIKVIPPHIVSIAPDNGETAVDPKTSVIVTFSEAIDKLTVTASNIYLKAKSPLLQGEGQGEGGVIPGVFSINPDGSEITLYPSELLKSEATYTVTITKSIRDLQGYLMGQDVTTTFKIKDMTPPPMPPAGSITGTFPDENGYVTINATQGSAEANDTVLIINDTTGEIVSVIPNSNGSFTGKITAQLGDEIKIVLMDKAGNQTTVTYITFKGTDGKYLVTAKGGIVEGEGGTKLIIPEGAFFGPTVVKISPVLEETLPHPVPAEGKFIGAVNIDSGGVKFQKEVKLSIPAPSGLPSDVKPFLTQPVVHTNVDGTEEKVYAVINSAKVIDGRVTTASPPFDGVLVPGMFVFVYSPPELKPVIVSGHTYINMDGIPGYTPGTGDSSDRPVKGAIIRTPAAMHFISYSDKDGHYAMFALNYTGAFIDGCGTFPITATHPFTMYKTSMTVQACAPYVLNNLNFKLGEKDTQCPDKTAPAITMNMTVASGQTARITAGTVNVGTNLNVPISIIDQDMSAVFLTVNYSDPASTSPSPTSVQVDNTDMGFNSIIEGCPNGTMKYTYTPQFDGTGIGSGTYFTPASPGIYNLVLEATDRSGNKSTKSLQIRATNPGEQPDSVDGAPRVDSIAPSDGARDIMVNMPINAIFSEPVDNVNENTFTLTDTKTGQKVPAYVYPTLEGGKMTVVLQPKGNLYYARTYLVTLTKDIKDTKENPSFNNQILDLGEDFTSFFTTKVPQTFDLTGNTFQTGGTAGIALFTTKESGKTYAYIAAGAKGWFIVDVTDPKKPYLVTSKNSITNIDYRGIAVDQDDGILAVTENINFADGGQYGYVRFYDLNANPTDPPRIGQEKLAEAFSGIPGRVATSKNYAYVATVMVGLQVVDIEAAKARTGASDGSTIVGIYDTNGAGYRQPSDIVLYNEITALLTTTSGHLLVLDLSIPQMPQLNTAFKPEGYSAFRADAVSGYTYVIDSGQQAGGSPETKVIDLAVTSSMTGKINTVDLTDPYNPSVIGTAKDAAENEVTIFARDIKVSGKTGLVFITTGAIIYVIDIKDPYNPRVLNTISETTNADGTMVSLGYSSALVEKDGWVYLANQQAGLRVLDLDPAVISIDPPYIILDKEGKPDKRSLTYTINSMGEKIDNAKVVIYKDGNKLDPSISLAQTASGVVEIAKADQVFDLNSTYYAQLVLNEGASNEERSTKVPFLKGASLIPNYNRDKEINNDDTAQANKGDTFYFWTNDDDDAGETGGTDIPNGNILLPKNYEDFYINGVRDLVDFFPVYLNIKDLMNIYSPDAYTYKLRSDVESMNFAFSGLMPTTVGNYLTDVTTAKNIVEQTSGKIYQIKRDGVKLNGHEGDPSFLQRIKNEGKGIILVEGRKAATSPLTSPLLLEIYDNNKREVVFTWKMNLSLSGAEDMFRHKNLIKDGGGPSISIPFIQDAGVLDRLDQPKGYPDKICTGKDDGTGKNFVFLHGYNVNPQQARGWQAEMFKRNYWSGSKAKFWGVSWYGSDTQTCLSGNTCFTRNYHINVRHAFATAQPLAVFLKTTVTSTGGDITIAAHSLGNMVVSSALSDHGATVKNYLMVDAAVAMEAYDGSIPPTIDMKHPEWEGYNENLWASEWYKLFQNAQTADNRATLTWRDRFKSRPSGTAYYNFFSSGEEVLRAHPYGNMPSLTEIGLLKESGKFAWALQEKLKGRMDFGWMLGSNYSGWSFNFTVPGYYIKVPNPDNPDDYDYKPIPQEQANALNPTQLKTSPFFSISSQDNTLYTEAGGSEFAANKDNRCRLLAEAFPARTLPAGGNETSAFPPQNNFDMQLKFQTNGWPSERGRDNSWLHGDIKTIAYPYVQELFSNFISLGGLNQ